MQLSSQQTHSGFTWAALGKFIANHRRLLIQAPMIVLFAVAASIPIPLLMPLLVDEVLLNQPASLVKLSQNIFPNNWQGPVLYITVVVILTVAMVEPILNQSNLCKNSSSLRMDNLPSMN